MGDPTFRATRTPISIDSPKIRRVETSSKGQQNLGDGDMSTVVILMHRTSGGALGLVQILDIIPENMWTWSILELWGTGSAPQGMTIQSFEDFISSSDVGYPLSWRELIGAASNLDQIHDCLIVATKSSRALSR